VSSHKEIRKSAHVGKKREKKKGEEEFEKGPSSARSFEPRPPVIQHRLGGRGEDRVVERGKLQQKRLRHGTRKQRQP